MLSAILIPAAMVITVIGSIDAYNCAKKNGPEKFRKLAKKINSEIEFLKLVRKSHKSQGAANE